MNKLTAFFAAALLSSLSFASVAAVQVSEVPHNQQQIGIIGATAHSNLGSLEKKLSEKADRLGGTSFLITSATGNNMLHGTAVVYK